RGWVGRPRGCGVMGSRGRFRSGWGNPRGGSSPLTRIALARATARYKRWMAEESTRADAVEQALILPAETGIDEAHAPAPSRLRELREMSARFEKSAAGRFWDQLSTAGFMNSPFRFAAFGG